MDYAVIRSGGKQYKVAEGDEAVFEKLPGKEGKEVVFDELLLAVIDGQVKIGTPLVFAAQVQGEILAQEKGEKIRVAKFRAKSRYRRVRGHRQRLTRVKIKKIVVKKESKTKASKKSPKTVKKS